MERQKVIEKNIHHDTGETPAARTHQGATGAHHVMAVGITIDGAVQQDAGTYPMGVSVQGTLDEIAQEPADHGLTRMACEKHMGEIIHAVSPRSPDNLPVESGDIDIVVMRQS